MSVSLAKSPLARATFTGPAASLPARVPVSNTDALILSLTLALATLDARGDLAAPGDREDADMLLDTLVMGRYLSTGKVA